MLPGAAPIRVALAVTLPQEHLRQAGAGAGAGGREAEEGKGKQPPPTRIFCRPTIHPSIQLGIRSALPPLWPTTAAAAAAGPFERLLQLLQYFNFKMFSSSPSLSCGMHARCSALRSYCVRLRCAA